MTIRSLMVTALLGALTSACHAHDPYGQVTDLAEGGDCERALTAFGRPGSNGPAELEPPRGPPAQAAAASASASAVVLTVEGGIAVGLGEPGALGPPPGTPDEADYTPLSRALRGVAACYEGRGDRGSLIMAFAQLQQIVESPLYGQTTEGEQQHVDAELDLVEGALRVLDPNYQQALAAKGRELDAAKSRRLPAH